MTPRALVVHVHSDGAEDITIDGHHIQFGAGSGGDGYCYEHQSFDCIDNLSAEQWWEIHHAERAEGL